MKKNILILSLVLAALLPNALTFARSSELDQLNLSPEQKQQIKAIRKKHLDLAKQEIDSILTAEQKAKRDELKAEKKAAKKTRKNTSSQEEFETNQN